MGSIAARSVGRAPRLALMALPAALLIRRIGYQRGILVGLVVLAFGAFLFIDGKAAFAGAGEIA